MKSLLQFIRESQESSDSKKFSFAFNGLENAKETIESLVNIAQDKGIKYESTEESFTVTLTRDLCSNDRDKIDSIQDILQQYSDMIRNNPKNSSSESYAQFTRKFEKTVDDMVRFIDDADNDDGDDDEE